MTGKTRIWLGLILLVPAMVIIAAIGLLVFDAVRPLPPLQPLPNPNGYADLAKAGQMIRGNIGDYDKANREELRGIVLTNAEALSLARSALSNQCGVTLQFSQAYLTNHLPELVGFRKLAQALATEGKLAEKKNRFNDAAKAYLDAIHFGNEAGRGGILVDEMLGVAIRSLGVEQLQKTVDQLDAKTCREAAATLEALDAQSQTWPEIMQQEHAWSRRTFPGIKYKLGELVMSSSLRKVLQKAGQKFKEHEKETRQLIIDLAARAYELDKGHRPANPADLVPDYLKAIPQDPVSGTNMTFMPSSR
jgi:hypothetical protein